MLCITLFQVAYTEDIGDCNDTPCTDKADCEAACGESGSCNDVTGHLAYGTDSEDHGDCNANPCTDTAECKAACGENSRCIDGNCDWLMGTPCTDKADCEAACGENGTCDDVTGHLAYTVDRACHVTPCTDDADCEASCGVGWGCVEDIGRCGMIAC
ncbi:hypothetical protein GE061_010098 [Apolygus lucorum]|uniref:Uncharacterized protein n=1 Tax=Apolygus lucorum TaxID=248454 RepID=A0A8S9Y4S8_APOLU|nr:hypothetical protein GE061_010098 [Apolygus lucorum]